ncbi:MAG: STAS domain-containing protein [Bacteroidales bacterium]|nr:STAS domain-containing protein [Bacteroidales bacterium]
MEISIQEMDGRTVAILSGEFDTAAAPEAEQALSPLPEQADRDILIDCTKLEYIASSGLRILLNIVKKAKAAGKRVILKGVNDVIREVLELTGFIKLFDFE